MKSCDFVVGFIFDGSLLAAGFSLRSLGREFSHRERKWRWSCAAPMSHPNPPKPKRLGSKPPRIMPAVYFDGNKVYRFSLLFHNLTLFPCLFCVFGLALNFVKSADKANVADFMHLTFLISQTHARRAFSIAEARLTPLKGIS